MIQLDPKTINAIADEVVRRLKRYDEAPRLVNSREAAKMLGISLRTLRRVQDRLPAEKHGEGKQARWMFDANRLVQSYMELTTN